MRLIQRLTGRVCRRTMLPHGDEIARPVMRRQERPKASPAPCKCRRLSRRSVPTSNTREKGETTRTKGKREMTNYGDFSLMYNQLLGNPTPSEIDANGL